MENLDVETAAKRLVEAAVTEVKRSFGRMPVSTQRSMFMLPAGPTSAAGMERARRTSGRSKLKEHIYSWVFSEPEPYRRFVKCLESSGVTVGNVAYGYALPLLNAWADAARPLRLSRGALNDLIQPLLRSVCENVSTTTSIDVVYGSFLNRVVEERIELEPGIVLRPITEDELWQFGDVDQYLVGTWRDQLHPYWAVLEIFRSHATEGEPTELPILKRAVIAALVLTYRAYFHVEPVQISQDFGPPGRRGGRAGNEAWQIRGAFNIGHRPRMMTSEERDAFVDNWVHAKTALTETKNYLRLPLERLMDSSSRERPDDGLIDAVIGLEALFTPNSSTETSLRFALTGAHLLGSDDSSRRTWYERLRRIYGLRSDVVHGRNRDAGTLQKHRMDAEEGLRLSWLRFASHSLDSGDGLLDQIRGRWLD